MLTVKCRWSQEHPEYLLHLKDWLSERRKPVEHSSATASVQLVDKREESCQYLEQST